MIQDIMHRTFLGNSIEAYAWFFIIALAGILFKRLLSKSLAYLGYKLIRKHASPVGYAKFNALVEKPIGIFILLITFYLAFDRLEFPNGWNLVPVERFGLRMILFSGFQIAIIFSLSWTFLRLIDFFGLILMHKASLTESKADDQLVSFIKEALKVVVIILSVFFILGAVFKLNIASLIAGLGIGGLAIALAAKESLENLLGSFTIFLDKPFTVGDIIKVGSIEGTVEHIGFRSTRIRTVEKTYLTVPNKKMVDSELDNLSLRLQRRVKFNISLLYETSTAQFKNIVADIQAYIDNHPQINTVENVVRMHSFADSGIEIMIVYFVNSKDNDIYLNIRQEVNYQIMDIVHKHGSDFAYPTTAVLMKK
ncbi:MAG TPA: mechanosensitive ion channel [Bacteroidia bacterium]|nr:mechanosensitive ion channel [Bacteroidia bacterium]